MCRPAACRDSGTAWAQLVDVVNGSLGCAIIAAIAKRQVATRWDDSVLPVHAAQEDLIMKPRRWISASFALITIALALSATAQTSGSARRRAVSPAVDEITILQTTDLHHHANGSDHVGLDVDPVSGTSVSGAYARIAAYVEFVRNSTT